jgi:hypothetical protein
MIVLAIDPGRTTGACVAEVSRTGFRVVTALEIPWESRLEILSALIDGTYFDKKSPQPPVAVVIENFRLRQGRALEQSGSDFPSSQVIGAVQAFLWMDLPSHRANGDFLLPIDNRPYGLERLHFQEPSCMARVLVLPEHAEIVRGSPHKEDAYKHARYFYIVNGRQYVRKHE